MYRMSDHIVSYWTQFRRDKNWTKLFKTLNNNTLNNVFLNSQILNSVLTV